MDQLFPPPPPPTSEAVAGTTAIGVDTPGVSESAPPATATGEIDGLWHICRSVREVLNRWMSWKLWYHGSVCRKVFYCSSRKYVCWSSFYSFGFSVVGARECSKVRLRCLNVNITSCPCYNQTNCFVAVSSAVWGPTVRAGNLVRRSSSPLSDLWSSDPVARGGERLRGGMKWPVSFLLPSPTSLPLCEKLCDTPSPSFVTVD